MRSQAPETLKEIVCRAIEQAHLDNRGSVARTARQLKISKTKVYRWLGIIHEEKLKPKIDPNQLPFPGVS